MNGDVYQLNNSRTSCSSLMLTCKASVTWNSGHLNLKMVRYAIVVLSKLEIQQLFIRHGKVLQSNMPVKRSAFLVMAALGWGPDALQLDNIDAVAS